MTNIEMVAQGGSDNFPQDGGGPGGQLHAAEVFNILMGLNSYGVDGSTLTMVVTGSDRLVTIPAFTARIPDGSGSFIIVVYAGGNATITASDASDPRVDIITLNSAGTLAVTAGAATTETGDVQEAPMPAMALDEIMLAKVKSPAAQTNVLSGDVFGRALDVSNAVLAGGVPTHQLIGAGPVAFGSSDRQHLVPIWKDTTGVITNCAMVVVLSTSTVAVVEYRRIGNDWVHDGTLGRDATVTLTVTAAAANQITAFGIDSPADSSNRLLFIATNDGGQTPDTFEVNSIDLNDGEGLTATAVTIAGANQPTDTNTMSTVSVAASTTSLLTIFEDDGHTAVISGDETGITLTYTGAKVAAIDTSIAVTNSDAYSLYLIGAQVVLMKAGGPIADLSLWEMNTSFVLTTEFLNVSVGLGFKSNTQQPSELFPIAGVFGVASAMEPGALTIGSARIAATFPLDSLVGNS